MKRKRGWKGLPNKLPSNFWKLLDLNPSPYELAGLFGVSITRMHAMFAEAPKDCVVPNVKQCELCGGIVDRMSHCFQCRKCHALGDFFTGFMTNLNRNAW